MGLIRIETLHLIENPLSSRQKHGSRNLKWGRGRGVNNGGVLQFLVFELRDEIKEQKNKITIR